MLDSAETYINSAVSKRTANALGAAMTTNESEPTGIDIEACDRAWVLMEEALAHLDKAGATVAAARLDYAICSVPTADPNKPRARMREIPSDLI